MALESALLITRLWHWLIIIAIVAAFSGIGALLNLYQKRRSPATAPRTIPVDLNATSHRCRHTRQR